MAVVAVGSWMNGGSSEVTQLSVGRVFLLMRACDDDGDGRYGDH